MRITRLRDRLAAGLMLAALLTGITAFVAFLGACAGVWTWFSVLMLWLSSPALFLLAWWVEPKGADFIELERRDNEKLKGYESGWKRL